MYETSSIPGTSALFMPRESRRARQVCWKHYAHFRSRGHVDPFRAPSPGDTARAEHYGGQAAPLLATIGKPIPGAYQQILAADSQGGAK